VINLPNLISLSRVPLLFVVAVLVFLPRLEVPGTASLAFVIFVLTALTDWLDGYVARKFNRISDFGKLMDALTDKILMVGVFVVLLAARLLPDWCVFFLLLIIQREFLITGMRLIAATKGQVLAAEKGGKIKTVLQIASVCVVLFAHAVKEDFTGGEGDWLAETGHPFLYWTGVALFLAATWQTAVSGWSYFRKNRQLFFDSAR